MDPGWHIYGRQSGDVGLPTQIQWILPEGFTAGPIQWPEPQRFETAGLSGDGYQGEVFLGTTVTPPPVLAQGNPPIKFSAQVSWLACKDSCVPGKALLELTLPVSPGGAPTPASQGEVFSFFKKHQYQQSLWIYLIFAFLSGLLLNVMPCVLPVLSLKILSFARQAGEDRRRIRQLGLAFTLGILVSFAILAATVIGLKAAGAQVGWGFQFQEPRFVIIMAAVVLAFSLSLLGVYSIELPGGALTSMDALGRREGAMGAFFNGMLATVLATPCTAPFLGGAMAFALTRSSWIILLFFLTIGAGMSTPYWILSVHPVWMRLLPKPGRWMVGFKQAMGFLLMATLIWLLSILGGQVGVAGVIRTLAFLLIVAGGCWMLGLSSTPGMGRRGRRLLVWIAALSVATSFFVFPEHYLRNLANGPGYRRPVKAVTQQGQGAAWELFTAQRVEELIRQRRTVFIDFTADWCLTCKVNERVLETERVKQAFKRHGVATLRADWTSGDKTIGRALEQFGRSGVPLYVIFPADRPDQPIVLPTLISPGLIEEKLDKIKI